MICPFPCPLSPSCSRHTSNRVGEKFNAKDFFTVRPLWQKSKDDCECNMYSKLFTYAESEEEKRELLKEEFQERRKDING
jgi:K+-transporting ATPase c subunit